jgi:DNA (cytosine-5)-methyltransferase 1
VVDINESSVSAVSASIFSGGGVGDAGIEWGAGIPVIAACEIVPSRANLIKLNFPETEVFEGDIWTLKDDYIDFLKKSLKGKRPWLITLSPPCQGMSANGAGRISSAIRNGTRPKEDERNRLVLPAIDVLEEIQPDWFILENVRRMENTVIRNENDKPENILDCLGRRLNPLGYTIRANILDFRDYGVPHHRQRLITIGCRIKSVVEACPQDSKIFRKELSYLHPLPTHGENCINKWVSISDSIGHLPKLDAMKKLKDERDPFHLIPKWNPQQYFWMSNTPEGQTAFENQNCLKCNFKNTDPEIVECQKCGSELARPSIIKNGKKRLIRGFKTSYRRMKSDLPASTLTMNSGVISSDMKGHPKQNRVLSLREILLLSTLDNEYWGQRYRFFDGKITDALVHENRRLVREVIGESIPPLALSIIVKNLKKLEQK